MTDATSSSVRVCLTRCPLLPPTDERVHSLPCRICFDGPAAVTRFFRPKRSNSSDTTNSTDHGGSNGEEQDVQAQENGNDNGNDTQLHAEFRGIQLQGEKVQLTRMGFTGAIFSLLSTSWSHGA